MFLYFAAVASAVDLSYFAALALLPESSNETTFEERDGVIFLYNVTDPVPTAIWSVRKVWSQSVSNYHWNEEQNLACDEDG